ncbi:MAG: hypothetical protein C0624_11415 [Desulfuromonas sp.]|nr:MAG: hypothetical protein C0624_11415 [Desulfuromonas sp.]
MNRDMRSELLAAACSPATQGEDGSVSQSFSLPETFIGFAGHFPDYPIVPAVTQLLAAQLLTEQIQGRPLTLCTVSHAKFLQQLLPQQTFTVTCRPKTGKPLCYDVRIHLDEELASSFRINVSSSEEDHG